jgi:hypothetical protein
MPKSKYNIYLVENSEKKLVGDLSTTSKKIGREVSGDDISLPFNAVSREHGVFKIVGDDWFYCDLGSANGSFAEGKLLDVNQHYKIHDGCTLAIANYIIRFELQQPKVKEPLDSELSEDHAELKRHLIAQAKAKRTEVFTPDNIASLRDEIYSDVKPKRLVSARPANRGRRDFITEQVGTGVYSRPVFGLLLLILLMILFVFFMIFFYLFV